MQWRAITDRTKSGFGLAPDEKPNGTGSRSSHPEETRCSQKIAKLTGKKAPMQESLFNKVAGPETCVFFKNRLQYSCFPVNFATF